MLETIVAISSLTFFGTMFLGFYLIFTEPKYEDFWFSSLSMLIIGISCVAAIIINIVCSVIILSQDVLVLFY